MNTNGRFINQQPAYDWLINSEFLLQHENDLQDTKVIQRSIGQDGTVAGEYYGNPMLNYMVYEADLPDVTIREYDINFISENMLTQVDEYSYTLTLIEGIIDYKNDETAVSKEDMWVVTKCGSKLPRKTTVGWKILVQWKDNYESWIWLKYIKESHPFEVAEFSKARCIYDETDFTWWVTCTLRKRNLILSAVKFFIRSTTPKYVIKLSTTIEEAININTKNGNNF